MEKEELVFPLSQMFKILCMNKQARKKKNLQKNPTKPVVKGKRILPRDMPMQSNDYTRPFFSLTSENSAEEETV